MSKVEDASEIFKAWLDGRLFFRGRSGLDDDELGLIEEAQGSSEPLGLSYCERLGLPAGSTVGEAARKLLSDQRRLRTRDELKDVSIDPDIEEAGFGPAVHQANEMLAEEVGGTSVRFSADWRLLRDKSGQPRLWLALSDDIARVTAPFDPRSIRHEPEGVRRRLRNLWGDFLQMISHKLLDQMQAAAASADGTC